MNINLFMGLNIKKSNPLPVPDAQISKLTKIGEPAYDKFCVAFSPIALAVYCSHCLNDLNIESSVECMNLRCI